MSERDIAVRAAAKDLFDQSGGQAVKVSPGRGCLTAQGLQQGLTAWYVKGYLKMANTLLPAGVSAQDALQDVQNELEKLCAAAASAQDK